MTAVLKPGSALATRALVCMAVCIALILGFYLSMIASAKSLTIDDKSTVRRAINVLGERGFADEVFLLENLTTFRADDNWLNASVAKENAYAATNFPFEIITLYPDFFTYPVDDTERATILLHEARHLRGQNEADAYRFVWENRKRLGWTQGQYSESPVWQNVRKQTRENVPDLFLCDTNVLGDCDE
ncbi:MAG: hypothetical protein ABIV21_07365 [Pyrinomonadaceae bacterium]